ncbi:unnamed protein product [Somion occarium]|uniref:Uncharacterized protein n=1 Tax=Somion occarium TaxID=3059160 RepID=A0ABP1DHQ6_9APHY
MPSLPPVVTADLSGKTVAVIGSNTGIGLEAAKHFARMKPARLICTCRNQAKADATVSIIEQETGYTKAESWVLELSEFTSVIAFANRFEEEGIPLDILVCNAAVALASYQKTSDGCETVAVMKTLNEEGSFCDPEKRYSDSKLLNVLFTRAIAHHIGPKAPVIVDTVNPGFCVSDLR